MTDSIMGALKWGAVGFVVTFILIAVYEAANVHADIPRPEFKKRHARRRALALSVFAGLLSGAVWLLVQGWD
ncbi:MAG: hypothetical protein M3R59_09235 [Verrucomicrobiota bacterium]|nr:hypothetical protein [Verrucomicrobiota bacterium]